MKFDTEELDQLADAVSERVLQRLKPLLSNNGKCKGNDTIFDVGGLAQYLCVKKSWVHGNIKSIPHYRVGQRPKFRKSKIDTWLESNRAPIMADVSPLTPFKLDRRPLDS